MNEKFDNKNTVKHTRKGPLGRTKRRNASVFYENTIKSFSKKDYGKDFAEDKKSFSYSVFKGANANKTQIIKFLTNINAAEPKLANGDSALSIRQAMGLRQQGWTLDRLLMRTRDMQYAESHKKDAKVFGDRMVLPANEKHLSVSDFIAFMQADRIVTTPEITTKLYTKQQLKDAGYKLTNHAMSVSIVGGEEYYDLPSCALSDDTKYDVAIGVKAKDVKLKALSPIDNLQVITDDLSNKFNIQIKPVNKEMSIESKTRSGGLLHKLGAKLSRLNTGIKNPIVNKATVSYNLEQANAGTVLDILNQVSSITVNETLKEFEKTVAKKFTAYKENKDYIAQATSALIAINMCKMGIFGNEDALALSKLQQANAIRVLSSLDKKAEENEVAIMDTITQVYSVALRRIAKVIDLDLETFATQSGVSYNDGSDIILDDILTKRSSNVESFYCSAVADLLVEPETQEVLQNASSNEYTYVYGAENKASPILPPGKETPLLNSGKPVKMIPPAKQKQEEPLFDEKLETSYKPADDYGYKRIELEDTKDIKKASKRLSSRINKDLIKKVNTQIIKPALVQIMEEHPDYMDDTKDDLCATIRIYNEIIKAEDLTDQERAQKIEDIKQKMIKVGEQDYFGDRKKVVEKALNLYELTFMVYKDVVSYKKSTKGLKDSTATKNIMDNYLKENGGEEVVQGEVRELIKAKVFEFEDSKTLG